MKTYTWLVLASLSIGINAEKLRGRLGKAVLPIFQVVKYTFFCNFSMETIHHIFLAFPMTLVSWTVVVRTELVTRWKSAKAKEAPMPVLAPKVSACVVLVSEQKNHYFIS